MGTIKEIAKELEFEINQKKIDLSIIESELIMNDLKVNDLVCWTNEHSVTKYKYLNVSPRIPYRKKGSKIMSKCLGNVDKVCERELISKKKEAIAFFKDKWSQMRKEFVILKNIS